MGLLQCRWSDGQLLYLMVFAVVAEFGSGPQAQDDVQHFLGALVPGIEFYLEVAVLVVRRASAHAELQPAMAQQVEHRRLFRQADRVVEGQNADAGADADLLGAGGHVREDGRQRGEDAVPAGVMLRHPDRIEAQLFGELDLLQGFIIYPALGAGVFLQPRGKDKQGKFHLDPDLLLPVIPGRVYRTSRPGGIGKSPQLPLSVIVGPQKDGGPPWR